MNPNSDKVTEEIVRLCTDLQSPPVIEIDPFFIDNERVDHALRDAGQFVVRVDLVPVTNKETLLKALYHNGDFPGYFGFNWDALDECLKDFHWRPAKGYILIYRRPDILSESVLSDFLEIIQGAAEWWRQQHIPFKLLVQKGSLASAG